MRTDVLQLLFGFLFSLRFIIQRQRLQQSGRMPPGLRTDGLRTVFEVHLRAAVPAALPAAPAEDGLPAQAVPVKAPQHWPSRAAEVWAVPCGFEQTKNALLQANSMRIQTDLSLTTPFFDIWHRLFAKMLTHNIARSLLAHLQLLQKTCGNFAHSSVPLADLAPALLEMFLGRAWVEHRSPATS